MIWRLFLLWAAGAFGAVRAAPIRKTGMLEENGAVPQEQINVLMFGVIQLSETLNHVYESTAAKMAKISEMLQEHEGALKMQRRKTEEAVEVETEMKEVIELLQAQMVEQQAQTQMAKDLLTSMEKGEMELNTKVTRLEMYLNTSIPPNIRELKERAEEHSSVLQGLQHLTQFQQENIEMQNEQISKLEKMSEAKMLFEDSHLL